MVLNELNSAILIGIAAGFSSGGFSGILDYTYALFIQKDRAINLVELALKSSFVGVAMAILLGIVAFIEVNFSTSFLSISQINQSTIMLAILLPTINFAIDKFLGMLASKKAE